VNEKQYWSSHCEKRGEVILESREPEGLLRLSLFEESLGCGFLLASLLLDLLKRGIQFYPANQLII
jgi:hypothetical protein